MCKFSGTEFGMKKNAIVLGGVMVHTAGWVNFVCIWC